MTQGNLPQELTSFVGRRREITETKRLLSIARLVTLTGIGGVGKTRLSLRVADDSRRAFGDGVWLVEFGELQDAALVTDTVAAALGVREQLGQTQQGVLIDTLSTRRLLLVLDNCEHLIDAVAALADALLRACPELRILATSREPLAIGGESVMRVPSLTVPDPDKPSTLAGLPRYEAIALFVERAAGAVPGFTLTEDNRVAVAQICHQLDGLPLPIELAAVRLRAMSAEQILERLSDRYRLLTIGSRGAPTRQQSLRMSVDWSHELCTAAEQVLWRRLTVFGGAFELDAVEGVCAGDGVPADLLDVVASLVDKSILIREGVGAAVRYRMLETLREYGCEKLEESGDYEPLHRRHRDWYEQLALRAESEWISARQVYWLGRLDREQPNLRDAMHCCGAAPGESVPGLRIATALYPYWLCRGQLGEGRLWLDRALAAAPDEPTPARVKALYVASVLAGTQGDLDDSAKLIARASALAEPLGDPASDLLVTLAVGSRALFAGELTVAIECFEEAVDGFRAAGALLALTTTLLGLAVAYGVLDDQARAVACHEEVLAITEPREECAFRGYSLLALSLTVWTREPARAAGLLQQGLRLARVVDDPLGSSSCVELLAWIAAVGGRYRRAAVLMGAAEGLTSTVGCPPVLVPNVLVFHEECERRTRGALTDGVFDTALQVGRNMSFEEALAYALDEQRPRFTPLPSPAAAAALTRREQQVAALVAQGLTNNAIAATLVIAQRTAQGHVEHVLAKLGFTSRTQIAAWFVEQAGLPPP